MPQQLIYTSAPQGVDVGRSGYCTVARSSTMGESLVQRLEQFSYYERLSEHGGEAERTIFIFRNIDIRGKAYHVLSRIKDAPADYTGRTNFIAQHLVFTPDEAANMPTPAALLNHWSGWKDQWEQEPRLFANESWAEFDELKRRTFLPAKHWFAETADYGRAAGLLGLNAGVFTAHDFKPKLILDLLSESLELLQLEGPNWSSLAWQRTFSVGCQPQDNPADFRWRFLTSGLAFESSFTQGRDPLELRRLRAPANALQIQFAQKGPVAPQFTRLPRAGEALQINEGETLILDGEALSLPGPSIYRWYRVEKDNVTLQEIDGEHGAKLETPNIPRGKLRYKVRAWDLVTDQYAESPLLVVEVKEKMKVPSLSGRSPSTSDPVPPSSRASKPVSQLQLKKNVTFANRTDENRLAEQREEETPRSFYRTHANTLLLSSVLLLVSVSTAWILQSMDFFAPHFKDHKRDWWAFKVTKNPLFFENSLRVTEETKQYIANYRKGIRSPKDKIDFRDYVLVWIGKDLIKTDADTPVRSDLPSQNEVPPLKPVIGQPKTSDEPVKKEPVKKLSGPIHVILAEPEWSRLIKPLDTNLAVLKLKQTAAEATITRTKDTLTKADDKSAKAKKNSATSLNKVELAKANDEGKQASNSLAVAESEFKQKRTQIESLEREITLLIARKKQANQLQHDNPWPYFPTNIPPTLRWSELGQKLPESGNTVSGVWRTNDWNFETDNWSLQVSQSGAVYRPTKQTNSLLVEIAKDENSNGTDPTLGLLLFSTNTSKLFQAKFHGDDLIPSDDLKTLLDNFDLKNNPLRINGRYGHITNPINHKIEESNKHGPWKLGIKEQLTEETKRADALKKSQEAFERLEIFWRLVKKSHDIHLRGDTFAKAVGDGIPKESFWEQVNRLCVVAIYQIMRVEKTPQLEKNDREEAWDKIKKWMEKEGVGGTNYQAELEALTKDLQHFKNFWDKHYNKKSYKTALDDLSKEIKSLQDRGSEIEPAKLTVDFQFHAGGTNWLTITRLDCR